MGIASSITPGILDTPLMCTCGCKDSNGEPRPDVNQRVDQSMEWIIQELTNNGANPGNLKF